MPPFLMGAPFQSASREDFLLDVDFTKWGGAFYDATTFQAQTFVAPDKTKLTYTKDYSPYPTDRKGELGETVQIGADTILASPAATQTNIASVGRITSAYPFGLMLQPTICNRLSGTNHTGPRVIDTSHGWSAGEGDTETTNYSDSPNQNVTGCTRVHVVPSIYTGSTLGTPPFVIHNNWDLGISPFQQNNVSDDWCLSSWQRSKDFSSHGNMYFVWGKNTNEDGAFKSVFRSASNTWAKLSIILDDGTPLLYFDVVECRDMNNNNTTAGGLAHEERDILVDYVSMTRGAYPQESIPQGSGFHAHGELNYSACADLTALDGSYRFRAIVIPKHGDLGKGPNTDQGTVGSSDINVPNSFFFQNLDGSANLTYAYLKWSDKKIYVRISSGTVYTSTSAISWGQYDQLEFFIVVGNGVTSVCKYRKATGPGTFGAWIDLGLSTISDVPPTTNKLSLMHNGSSSGGADDGDWAAWLSRISFYRHGGPPGV